MKAMIDQDTCIGCGLCAETCPAVFRMGDEGIAEVYANPVPQEEEAAAAEARDLCPVTAITLE